MLLANLWVIKKGVLVVGTMALNLTAVGIIRMDNGVLIGYAPIVEVNFLVKYIPNSKNLQKE
jgi:hypothetical protein